MKKNKMNKSIHQFNKACAEMGEYIEAFAFLPPMGEGVSFCQRTRT